MTKKRSNSSSINNLPLPPLVLRRTAALADGHLHWRPHTIFIMLMQRHRWSTLDEMIPHYPAHFTAWRTIKLWPVEQGCITQVFDLISFFFFFFHCLTAHPSVLEAGWAVQCTRLETQRGQFYLCRAAHRFLHVQRKRITLFISNPRMTQRDVRPRKHITRTSWPLLGSRRRPWNSLISVFYVFVPCEEEKTQRNRVRTQAQNWIFTAVITRLWQIYRLALLAPHRTPRRHRTPNSVPADSEASINVGSKEKCSALIQVEFPSVQGRSRFTVGLVMRGSRVRRIFTPFSFILVGASLFFYWISKWMRWAKTERKSEGEFSSNQFWMRDRFEYWCLPKLHKQK